MSEALVYHSGELRPADTAAAELEREWLAARDGLFETMLVVDGAVHDRDAHLGRLLRSLAAMGAEGTEAAALAETVDRVAEMSPWSPGRLRLTAVAVGTVPDFMVTTTPYSIPALRGPGTGVQVALLEDPVVRCDDTARQTKSLAWRREGLALLASRPGVYDALLLNDAGRVAEGTRTNVVVARAGAAITPALSEGCLPGTVRRRLLEAGVVQEGEVDVTDVRSGNELVLTNSLVGAIPVGHVDGVSCAVRGLATRLREVWAGV